MYLIDVSHCPFLPADQHPHPSNGHSPAAPSHWVQLLLHNSPLCTLLLPLLEIVIKPPPWVYIFFIFSPWFWFSCCYIFIYSGKGFQTLQEILSLNWNIIWRRRLVHCPYHITVPKYTCTSVTYLCVKGSPLPKSDLEIFCRWQVCMLQRHNEVWTVQLPAGKKNYYNLHRLESFLFGNHIL